MKGYRKRRQSWPEADDKYIWARDKNLCVYCGERGQEIDHVVPFSGGGPTIRSNGVLACKRCNRYKKNHYPIDLLTRAFFHLLVEGEDIDWLDNLWQAQQASKERRMRVVHGRVR